MTGKQQGVRISILPHYTVHWQNISFTVIKTTDIAFARWDLRRQQEMRLNKYLNFYLFKVINQIGLLLEKTVQERQQPNSDSIKENTTQDYTYIYR